MGQMMPLPSRIPEPTTKQLAKLTEMGVTIGEKNEGYVRYTMPSGWKMVDQSWREDLPNFAMVDTDGNIRVTINGSWKGTYDNELHMRIASAPFDKYEPKDEEPIMASETSESVMIAKFGEAMTGMPAAIPTTTRRHSDYE
jgi:hypothetical protein